MERVAEAALRRQRTIQTVLLFIILATLPFYCLGGVLLLTAPAHSIGTPTLSVSLTAQPGDATSTLYPSFTPFGTISVVPTFTPYPSSPLLPTPTQIFLVPTIAPPTYIQFPTPTSYAPPTITAIIIIPPTSTSRPTNTTIPILPTSTPIPILPTSTPIPTSTFIPTIVPQPTHTPTATNTLQATSTTIAATLTPIHIGAPTVFVTSTATP